MRFPFFRKRAKMSVPVMAPVTTPVTRAIERLRQFFEKTMHRYELYQAIERLDPKFQGAINAAAIVVAKCLKDFTVKAGERLDREEADLLQELKLLNTVLKPYAYDIAYKLFRDGDVCYVVDLAKGVGIRSLVWLPMTKLTILEDRKHATRFDLPVREPNWYCLNEIPTMHNPTQWFRKDQVVHFNWSRTEEVYDRYGRYTYGIYTLPPLESLAPDLIWKFAIKINDMLLREVLVPREHHKIPSEAFNPDLFSGDTQEDRIVAAQAAAQKALDEYTKQLKGRRVDRGYVTLDTTEIDIIEPKMSYSDPNPLLEQIDSAIYGSLGVPESVVSGRPRARGTFASEVALGSYLIMKAEFIADLIAKKFIDLAKRHITVKFGNQYLTHFPKIGYKLQLIFFVSEMARLLAVLSELGLFTKEELRDMFGYPPLTAEQEQEILQLARKRTTSVEEITAATRRSVEPRKPETPWTRARRQVT